MAVLKLICVSFSLTQLLSLAVGSLNINEKWFSGNHFGYGGEFCLPGICIGGGGSTRVHLGSGDAHFGFGVHGNHLSGHKDRAYLEGGDEGTFFGGNGNDDDHTKLRGYASGCGWSGNHDSYCSGGLPGVGGGASYRETMYCKPVACTSGSCRGLHIHLDKGLYKSLVSKRAGNFKEAEHSSPTHHKPETLEQKENNVKEAAMVKAPESN
ncbi:PREDICTED: uncharacterized protein LOC104821981 [Tarenaya hassleriana]|uniref:uncharacterized protein LOC104821981 n=1 Tax=Tarenaya hassleriana TaxID=28532 RepID=UPI00053C552E|nr:PREDICTED: uncharacterized protein LOC104821981 [Tarenaya hassleriana]